MLEKLMKLLESYVVILVQSHALVAMKLNLWALHLVSLICAAIFTCSSLHLLNALLALVLYAHFTSIKAQSF